MLNGGSCFRVPCDLRDLEDEADEWIYLNHVRDIRFAEPHFGKDRLTAFGNAMNSHRR